MKIIEKSLPITEFEKSLPFLPENSVFFDIETTGFSPDKNPIYLIGSAFISGDSLKIVQYLAEKRRDEPLIIRAFFDLIKNKTNIITFNGSRFDIPYIIKRAEKHSLENSILSVFAEESGQSAITFLDLLKEIRKSRNLLGLKHYNQKSIEEFLGIIRKDEYDGGKLIDVYRRYEKKHESSDESLLLLHNYEDVKNMTAMLVMLSYGQTHIKSIESADWDFDDGHLLVSGELNLSLPVPVRLFTETHYIILEENRIKAGLPIVRGSLKYYYPYPQRYMYLLREQIVVPKELASTIPQAEKRPAKKEECFTFVSDDFLCVDTALLKEKGSPFGSVKLFKNHYKDTTSYIKKDPEGTNENSIRAYLDLIIS